MAAFHSVSQGKCFPRILRDRRPSALLRAVSLSNGVSAVALTVMLIGPATSVAALPTLYVYDLNYTSGLSAAQRYDIRHAAVCIQGLANRQAPRVFLNFFAGDAIWLTRLRESGGLCEGWPVRTLSTLDDLLTTFHPYINGVVLYDPDPNTAVSSTSLAASTAAGIENAIALRKDTAAGSLYNKWVTDPLGPKLPVVIDLTGRFTGTGTIWQTVTPSTGSAKCDAYIWARQKYLDNGRCDPGVLSYTLDLWGLKLGVNLEAQLSNLDYAISKRGFCFELSPWGDEKPNDDPNQPLGADRCTFLSILNACNQRTRFGRMIKFIGFVNWPYKYTNHTGGSHGDVETEWETASLLTAYNAYKEADAAGQQWISNASFYAGLLPPMADRRYVQNPAPTYADMQSRGLIDADGHVAGGNYVLIGLGDYDQASWTLYWLAGDRYNDPARGQATCNWGIDPNAVDRASVAMDYMYRHKTDKDFFVAWDSGAGYINPSQLAGKRSPSGYPSGVAIWRDHCKKYYRMFDYSITAWMLNGIAGGIGMSDWVNFAPFSGDGIGYDGAPADSILAENIPVLRRFPSDDFPPPIIKHDNHSPNFAWYRTIIRRPSEIKTLEDSYANSALNHRFLDAYTFYYLLRYTLGGNNNYRATWVAETIPRIMAAGRTYNVNVTVRNDGWDAWTDAAGYRLGHAIVPAGTAPANNDYDAAGHHPLPAGISVLPGQIVTFNFNLTAPAATGNFDLYYDMVRENITWFRDRNNIEWQRSVVVAAHEDDVDTDRDGYSDVWEQSRGRLYWHPGDGFFKLDFDRDGDVDRIDFAHLQHCFTGMGVPQLDPTCANARVDHDLDVDQDDVMIFIGCMSGPDRPVLDPECAD